MKRAFFAFLAMSLAACPPPSGQLPTGPDPNSGGGGGGDPGGGGAAPPGAGGLGSAACPLTTIGPSPGLEGCYDCMLEKCCAEVQACDGDPDCVYCTSAEGQIDSSERCVDPSTFSVYPNRRGFADCQVNQCVSPCGAVGGANCTPQSCTPSCPNYGSGCH